MNVKAIVDFSKIQKKSLFVKHFSSNGMEITIVWLFDIQTISNISINNFQSRSHKQLFQHLQQSIALQLTRGSITECDYSRGAAGKTVFQVRAWMQICCKLSISRKKSKSIFSLKLMQLQTKASCKFFFYKRNFEIDPIQNQMKNTLRSAF